LPTNKNYYAILGLKQNATQTEIEAAYRQIVGSYRPEPGKRRPLNQRHVDIVEAYETLKDPRARRKYDRRRGVNPRSSRSILLIAAGIGIVVAGGIVAVVIVAKGGAGSSTTANISATPRSPTPTRIQTPTPVGQTPAPTPPPSPPAISAPFVTTASGLQIATISQGTGAPPQAHNTVTVNYTGWVQGGGLFDSSLSPGRSPYKFVLGEQKVIKAWDEAVAQMQVGGLYRIIAPPDLAYGAAGSLPVVPPNATLVYDISVLDTGAPSSGSATAPTSSH
jgi:FKBP-type peptidyl-prolyl cis-trans isomerase/DnaJ domain